MEDIVRLVHLFVVGLRSNMHTYVSQWGISVLRQTMLQLLRNTHCYPDTVNACVRVAVNWGKVGPFVSVQRSHDNKNWGVTI